jgi:hypothetical protein
VRGFRLAPFKAIVDLLPQLKLFSIGNISRNMAGVIVAENSGSCGENFTGIFGKENVARG